LPIFKTSIENVENVFQKENFDIQMVKDGKHTWPAVNFKNKQHVLDSKKEIIELFENL